MKKTLLVLSVLLFTSLSFSQINTVWERNQMNSNVPSWTGASTERGVAGGMVDGNLRVYVVTRNGENAIKTLNGETGEDVTLDTDFDLSNVSGGLFAVNDVEVSDDGKIVVCNMTLDASANGFSIYVWTSEGGSYDATYTLNTANAYRIGDAFNVTGSWDDGTFTVWAGAASSDPGIVYKITTTDQGTTWDYSYVTLSGAYASLPSACAIAPFEDGSFYLSGAGGKPRKHDATGAYVSMSLQSETTSSRRSCDSFKSLDDEYIATYGYRSYDDAASSGIIAGRAAIRKVTNPSATEFYAQTPAQGDVSTYGATNGDVAVFSDDDSNIYVAVLGADQGIGLYKLDLIVPVELTSFAANVVNNSVKLNWTTATELNNSGFSVERNGIEVGYVKGNGTSSSVNNYSFTDANVAAGTYTYRLKQVDFDGSVEYSAEIEVTVGTPVAFELAQNFPNPFNPSTNIQFSIPEASQVNLTVYNLLGEEVASLVSGIVSAGVHNISFDASNLNSGMYIYKIEAGSFVATRKMMLLK